MLLITTWLACQSPPPLVLFVSMDTTRADALGAYGGPPSTPNVDALAAEGVRVERGLSQSATTLASHTGVFSGRESHGSTVVRNGFPVPGGLPLLQERFAAKGWDTIAVVGSTALQPEMGLSRGFRVYDNHELQLKTGVHEVSADQVTQAALRHIDAQGEAQPTFLFVHYYDPHNPWNSAPTALRDQACPEPYQGPIQPGIETSIAMTRPEFAGSLGPDDLARARCLYQAEVQWTDQQIGALIGGLRERERLESALIVLFSDHGEHLGSDGGSPFGHGPDVDPSIVHVPLIFWGSGELALPASVVHRPIRLMDVGPSVLGLLGWESDLGDGEDTSAILRGERSWQAPPSFAEATQPASLENGQGWNNLPFQRSVTHQDYSLVVTPYRRQAQLYAWEPSVHLVQDPQRVEQMVAQLRAWDATAPPHRSFEATPEMVEALRALGYMD